MCLTHGLTIPNQEEPGCAMVSIPLISIPSYMFLNTYFGYISATHRTKKVIPLLFSRSQ